MRLSRAHPIRFVRALQLLELRAVVARMLGLDVSTLPVPDVEILNRIERLVRAHDENSLAAFTADRDLEHVSREFRSGEILYISTIDSSSESEPKAASTGIVFVCHSLSEGYDEAGRLLGRRRPSLSSGASSAQPHHHKRSRSPSPVHRSPARRSPTRVDAEVDPRHY